MTFKETMAKLFSTSEGTYYKWKKEDRPIIKLLEKYFDRTDLEEFLVTGNIKKMEGINLIEKERYQLFNIFDTSDRTEVAILEYIIEGYKEHKDAEGLYNYIINVGMYYIINGITSIEYDRMNNDKQQLLSLLDPIPLSKKISELTEKIRKLTTLQVTILVTEHEELLVPRIVLMKDVPYSKKGNV